MSNLNGKNVVITGGSSGIGLVTAQLFQSEGARVAITGRDAKTLDAARKELGAKAVVIQSDTSKVTDIDALVAKAKSEFGHVDVLFVNAGVAVFTPFETVTEAFWDNQHNINVRGAFFTIQKFLPLLKSGSSIVLNTSVVDEKGMPNTSTYAASKAALRSLARTLAGELAERGIRVNAVSPGPIATPIYGKLGFPPDQVTAFQASMASSNPMKRFGRSDEVAKAVRYLAIDATYTTGSELPVDGGLTQI
jgi:NAD(P)-dependent dehydrogenase (short-subunit alcohol dehydrogenase family)